VAGEKVVPENWVIFQLGERKTLHFYDHAMVVRELTDPITGKPKRIESLVLYVDEENGVKVEKMFSVLSRTLAEALAPYIEGKKYLNYNFIIEKPAFKYAPPRLVEVRPR